jgi:hypothetical protein
MGGFIKVGMAFAIMFRADVDGPTVSWEKPLNLSGSKSADETDQFGSLVLHKS